MCISQICAPESNLYFAVTDAHTRAKEIIFLLRYTIRQIEILLADEFVLDSCKKNDFPPS